MWKEFFPNGRVIGVDINDKSGLAEDRVTILRGDQGDGKFLRDLGELRAL